MFQGLRAWFSSSTDETLKQIWRDNGGTITNLETAEFIFSSDNTCHDTERVFASDEYMNEHLAIFHSSYVSDCIKAGGREKVILGKYFLPPPDIAQLVKKQMTFCWDTQTTSSESIPQKSPGKRSVAESSSIVSVRQRQYDKTTCSSQNYSSPRGIQRPQRSSCKNQASSPRGHTAEKKLSSDGSPKSTEGAKSQIRVEATPGCSSLSRKRRAELPQNLHLSPSKNLRSQRTSSLQQLVRVRRQDTGEDSHRAGPSGRQGKQGEHTGVGRAPGRAVTVAADVHISHTSLDSDGKEKEQPVQTGDRTNSNAQQKTVVSDSRESYVEETDDSEFEETEVVDIKDLPKPTGILEDFIPGKDGCKVYIRE